VAYVALGSNLGSHAGDAAATVLAGIGALGSLAVAEEDGEAAVVASSLYATAPVGFHDQPLFVNAVVRLRTLLGPEALLEALLAIERSFGRVREVLNGPRTLDLDLLMEDDLVMATAALTLPHPRIGERRFVLAPLVEIAPGLRHPVLGRTMAELLAALPDAGEQAVDGVQRIGAAASQMGMEPSR
jgi:2-amino-4-hydroxy-6-hydroxymethyldihydropteridine diphosphokinase